MSKTLGNNTSTLITSSCVVCNVSDLTAHIMFKAVGHAVIEKVCYIRSELTVFETTVIHQSYHPANAFSQSYTISHL
jgi:hypothetical protein